MYLIPKESCIFELIGVKSSLSGISLKKIDKPENNFLKSYCLSLYKKLKMEEEIGERIYYL